VAETTLPGITSPVGAGAGAPVSAGSKVPISSPDEALAAWAPGDGFRQGFPLDGGKRLAVAVRMEPDGVRVSLACNAEAPLVLHWGVAWQYRQEWQLPPENQRPAGTTLFEQKAARTSFGESSGLGYLELFFPKAESGPNPRGMRFVLHQPMWNAWLKSGGKELFVPLFEPVADPRLASPRLLDLSEQIISAEKGALSWTLMHRFHLCHDLLDGNHDEDSLALLFAWLRYSAIRQLDWQRRYNTKPRDLSHAQERLTRRLAAVYRMGNEQVRPWVRLMLTTLGRGGEGQRVRDEILNIMHRNNIKEAHGTFIEEWHQKLHNNTTPDDVVICEAYLAFLKSNGDVGRFYRTLEAGGVTRERLAGFERPIRTDPVFFSERKDALVREFEGFLSILKSVHAGTDLETSVAAVRGRVNGNLNRTLDFLLGARRRGNPDEMLPAILSAREDLAKSLAAEKDHSALRDLLFLDLALEELLRGLIERQNLSQLDQERLVKLVGLVARNVELSIPSRELSIAAGHWSALAGAPRDGRDWSLQAKSVADRLARWVANVTDAIYRRLQPRAEFLGEAFGAAAWSIPLFSEEVIRGGPPFALSLLLRALDPLLRKSAGLGGWQVISPAIASGKVRVVDQLLAVQGERFTEPTVLIADRVSGSEEVPERVTAVITSDAPDLVSHVGVRARNAGVLFATCFEPKEYERLKALRDKGISLQVTPAGDVRYEEAEEDKVTKEEGSGASVTLSPCHPVTLSSSSWVLTHDQFTPAVVGGKSNNLNGLRGRLPDWIGLPASVALPFGAMEKALADESNRDLRREYDSLVESIEKNPERMLARLRDLVMKLNPPAELQQALLAAWQRVGLAGVPWEQAWTAIRRVWSSVWNDRAYYSRRAWGMPHDALKMAVLIQQVVPAEYAFVIHTANPLTGNRDQCYAEVVLGMGETLVGNHPGRALSFLCGKSDWKIEILAYPSKSIGLHGKGVIFRSDSNGEDRNGFAGAGLYDSYLAEEPEPRLLDYRGERLVSDKAFREEMLRTIARIGVAVEKILDAPQDIEGAVAAGRFHVVQTRPQVGLDPAG
jgi:alpha-glucan,water dikinase